MAATATERKLFVDGTESLIEAKRLAGSRKRPTLRTEVTTKEVTDGIPFVGWSHKRLQREWDRDDKSDLAWTVALADELHRRGFPVW